MPGNALTTTCPPRVAVPPTLMRSLKPAPATSVRNVPVEDCVKLPVTVAVPIELPGAMTPELAKLPTTLPIPDQVPMLTTLPITVPLLVNEPAAPLMTEPVNVPVLVAVATLARLPRNVPVLVNVPWLACHTPGVFTVPLLTKLPPGLTVRLPVIEPVLPMVSVPPFTTVPPL